MKQVIVPVTFIFILLVGFFGGLLTQSTMLLLPSFCLWTPGVFWLGFAVAKTGLRISVNADNAPEVSAKVHRQRQKEGVAFQ